MGEPISPRLTMLLQSIFKFVYGLIVQVRMEDTQSGAAVKHWQVTNFIVSAL